MKSFQMNLPLYHCLFRYVPQIHWYLCFLQLLSTVDRLFSIGFLHNDLHFHPPIHLETLQQQEHPSFPNYFLSCRFESHPLLY